MSRNRLIKPIAALGLALCSGMVAASGFQLLEQTASGIGNAYAGSAAIAENASTIYFNPAGMTRLGEREVTFGVSAVRPGFAFEDDGSSVGALAGSGEGGDAGGWSAIPNVFASMALTKDLYLGLGVSAPFGLKTEYDTRWLGAAQSVLFDLKTVNVNPSLAYRVNERVSLGLGLNWQSVDAKYVRIAGTTASTSHVLSTMKFSDSGWGWNAGVLFAVSPAMNVGLSYRSKIRYTTEGTVALSGDGTATGAATAAALTATGRASDVEARLTMPDTWILSVSQKLNNRWTMLGDVSRTGWRSIPKVDIVRTSGALSGQIAQTLDTDYRNTWRIALGANYQYNDQWVLKYGVAYDQAPVKRAATRLAALPENDRVWLSFGAQWAPTRVSRFDFGASYIYIRDSRIDNDQSAYARGVVTGDYSGNIWVLGAQYSLSF